MKTALQAYVHGSIAAVDLYQRAFGATLRYHERHPDGTFLHAKLYVDGDLLLAVSESNNEIAKDTRMRYSATACPAMNFCVDLKDEHAVKHAYEVLQDDANIFDFM